MYSFLLWNNYCDKKVKNKHLFFSLVFARIEGKRMRAKDQKQTIYFKRPNARFQFRNQIKLRNYSISFLLESKSQSEARILK